MTPHLNELALFAGAGGGILGGKLLGWRCVCAVEINNYARRVLIARQDDGSLPAFPIWDDVCTFDGKPWRGVVDIITGGFPCQDISAAGKGAGIEGERSGLWREMARIIGEVRPRFVLVENSPMLVGRGLAVVLGDLAALGYDARWGIVGAHHAGAPHKRDRIWIVANADKERCGGCRISESKRKSLLHTAGRGGCNQAPPSRNGTEEDANVANAKRAKRRSQRETCKGMEREVSISQREKGPSGAGSCGQNVPNPDCERGQLPPLGQLATIQVPRSDCAAGGDCEMANTESGGWLWRRTIELSERTDAFEGCSEAGSTWWSTEPDVGRVAHGVASRVDRLKAIGNGQVPAALAMAWRILTADLHEGDSLT